MGDIVRLKDEDLVCAHWKLAKVDETMPSKDGLVRKVQLLLADSNLTSLDKRVSKPITLERPIHKVATRAPE